MATTHGVASQDSEPLVQPGHWAIVHDGKPYLTAYAFDKSRPSGRKFFLSVQALDGQLVVEIVDVDDSYRKRVGISRLIDDGATIELAFNMPLDGSDGPMPISFDSKSEPNGFVSIVLKRLSDRPDLARSSREIHPQASTSLAR